MKKSYHKRSNINPAKSYLNKMKEMNAKFNDMHIISIKFGILIARTLFNILLINTKYDKNILKDINNKFQKISTDNRFIDCTSINDLFNFIKLNNPELEIDENKLLEVMPILEGSLGADE